MPGTPELFWPSLPYQMLSISRRKIVWRYWQDERAMFARIRQLHLEQAQRR